MHGPTNVRFITIMSDSYVTPVAATHFKLRFFITVQSRFSESRLFEVPCPLSLYLNPLKPELNPICYLLALLGAHHFLHVSRIRVKLLTLR